VRNSCKSRVNYPCEGLGDLGVGQVGIGQSIPRHVVRLGEWVRRVSRRNLQYCWVVGIVDTHADITQGDRGTGQLRAQIVGPSGVVSARAGGGAGDCVEVPGNGAGGSLVVDRLAGKRVVRGIPSESADANNRDVKCITYRIAARRVTPTRAFILAAIQAILNSECVGIICFYFTVISVKAHSETVLRNSCA
jgi:hypothetical protein